MNRRLVYLCTTLVVCVAALACGDDPSGATGCLTTSLPFAGNANAPRLVDVTLDVQINEIAVLATATDPQGSDNMDDVVQKIGVFPDRRCQGAPIILLDDLACSGCEESFGTLVTSTQNKALFDQIDAATSWPVEVDFVDKDGNRTTARLLADISH